MKAVLLRDLQVSRIGLGAMGLTGYYSGRVDEGEASRIIGRALDLGVTLVDTAELYGPFTNEEFVGRALKGRRGEVVLATKFGWISHPNSGARMLDSSSESIRAAVEGSLRRLCTDWIDLYYQHRVDPKTPIEDVMGTLANLVEQGKVRHIGLSEADVDTVRRANAVHPITAVQSEYSLWTRDPEPEILPALRDMRIGFVAFSPLGRGFLTGQIRSTDQLRPDDPRRGHPRFLRHNLQENIRIVEVIESLAQEIGATPAQVAIAWLIAQGDDIVPIPGADRISHVDENLRAIDLVLTPEQCATLERITPPLGDRYPDMSTIQH